MTTEKPLDQRYLAALEHKICEKDFPPFLLSGLKQAATAMMVNHESLFVSLLAAVNNCMLHSVVSYGRTSWIEPVMVWPICASASGTRKTAVHKYVIEILDESVNMLNRDFDKDIQQWRWHEGSTEKLGTVMEETEGKIFMFQDEASRIFNSNLGNSRSGNKDQSPMEVFLLETYNGKY